MGSVMGCWRENDPATDAAGENDRTTFFRRASMSNIDVEESVLRRTDPVVRKVCSMRTRNCIHDRAAYGECYCDAWEDGL